VNRTGVSYDAYTPEEQAAIRDDVLKYTRSELPQIEVRLFLSCVGVLGLSGALIGVLSNALVSL